MGYQILVVEDQKEIREIVSRYLEKEGYQVHAAKDGFEALEIFNTVHVHLIVLDVMMPGIDGFERCACDPAHCPPGRGGPNQGVPPWGR